MMPSNHSKMSPGTATLDVARIPATPDPASVTMQLVSTSQGGFGVAVLVGDVPVTLGPPWDVLALVASGGEPGGYYLGNCDCGAPRCAGVLAPVRVQHSREQITWTIPWPYAPGLVNKQEGETLTLTFDAAQYRAQAASLLAALRQLTERSTVCCYPTETLNDLIAWADSGDAGHGGKEPLLV